MGKNNSNFILIMCGLAIGFVNGFFGGGGGMICVPLLIYAARLPVKKAHATALLIILPISIVSSIFYLAFGALDVMLLLYTGIGVIAGGVCGALILPKMSNKAIKVVFAAIMLAAGLKMLF